MRNKIQSSAQPPDFGGGAPVPNKPLNNKTANTREEEAPSTSREEQLELADTDKQPELAEEFTEHNKELEDVVESSSPNSTAQEEEGRTKETTADVGEEDNGTTADEGNESEANNNNIKDKVESLEESSNTAENGNMALLPNHTEEPTSVQEQVPEGLLKEDTTNNQLNYKEEAPQDYSSDDHPSNQDKQVLTVDDTPESEGN